MVDAVKRFTINDSKYYESNTANASDTQCDITRITETVTHTRNGNFEQKILSNRTIPVVVLTMIPMIDQSIPPIAMTPQTLLTPATKEVVAETASGRAWVNRTPQQVIQTGVDGSTPGDICNAVRIKNSTSPVLIGIVGTSPTCGLNGILNFVNERNSTSLGLVDQTPKMDSVVDGKLPDEIDSA